MAKKKEQGQRYPQISTRMDGWYVETIRDQMRRRGFTSQSQAVKQALRLYFALDLPSHVIELLHEAREAKGPAISEAIERAVLNGK